MAPRRGWSVDPIALIEALYASTPDQGSWLRGIQEVVRSLDAGFGVATYAYDAADTALAGVPAVASTPGCSYGDMLRRGHATFGVEGMHAILGHSRFSTMRRDMVNPLALADAVRLVQDDFPGGGNMFAVVGAEREGVGCGVAITGVLPANMRIPPRTVHTLNGIARHLKSAVRLRKHAIAGEWSAEDPSTGAVFDPSGRLRHASPSLIDDTETQRRLANLVRRMDAARSCVRQRDPDEAMKLWHALLAGEWSLVERVDRDGQRLILARRNSGDDPTPGALLSREQRVAAYAAAGHSNKFIAYELGIAASTVSLLLDRAIHRLGCSSRLDLIQLFAVQLHGATLPSSS